MRTEIGGEQATVRRWCSKAGAETFIPSDGASRSLSWALVARPRASSASRRRLVMRAYDCTRSASLSVKIWRGQVGVVHTNLRTVSANMTRRPAHGRSATVLAYRPWTRSEGCSQSGQVAQGRREVIWSTTSVDVVRIDEM